MLHSICVVGWLANCGPISHEGSQKKSKAMIGVARIEEISAGDKSAATTRGRIVSTKSSSRASQAAKTKRRHFISVDCASVDFA